MTYTIFVIFFLLLSIVALNVLVGLIVDGIPNFLQNADVWMLTLLLRIVIERDRNMQTNAKNIIIIKHSNTLLDGWQDLIPKEMIWKKMEMRQKEKRRRAELEAEKNDLIDSLRQEIRMMRGMDEERKRRKRKGAGVAR